MMKIVGVVSMALIIGGFSTMTVAGIATTIGHMVESATSCNRFCVKSGSEKSFDSGMQCLISQNEHPRCTLSIKKLIEEGQAQKKADKYTGFYKKFLDQDPWVQKVVGRLIAIRLETPAKKHKEAAKKHGDAHKITKEAQAKKWGAEILRRALDIILFETSSPSFLNKEKGEVGKILLSEPKVGAVGLVVNGSDYNLFYVPDILKTGRSSGLKAGDYIRLHKTKKMDTAMAHRTEMDFALDDDIVTHQVVNFSIINNDY